MERSLLAGRGGEIEAVLDYIRKAFPRTVKHQPPDRGDILGLPRPYTSPCIKKGFTALFYWDTYFTNLGLLGLGRGEQARWNVENLFHLVERFGFVPNASRRSMTNRSQLPLLGAMVRDLPAADLPDRWVERAYGALAREHRFWMTRRLAPIGLNRPGNTASEGYLLRFFDHLARVRFPGLADRGIEDRLAFSRHALSECEVWDFTPRFARRAGDFCPVDLNCALLVCEEVLADLGRRLGREEEAEWRKRAARRRALIDRHLWHDRRQCYSDYDYARERKGDVISCAALFPLWAGCASREQAAGVVRAVKDRLEFAHGLAACAKGARAWRYQWDHPNAWPPLQCIAVQALDRYGYEEDARRIATKYVSTVCRNFARTGLLWEKYNALDGTTRVQDEYAMPPMVGWTAGTYVFCLRYLDRL